MALGSETSKKIGDRFEDNVAQLFKLMRYNVEQDRLMAGAQIDIYAELYSEETRRVIIECKNTVKPVGIDRVNRLSGQGKRI